METPEEQIEKLATFIMKEVPGEPSRSEGAVECAIRVMKAARATKACLHCGGPLLEGPLLNRPGDPHSDDAHEDCWDGFFCPTCHMHWSQVDADPDDLCPRIPPLAEAVIS